MRIISGTWKGRIIKGGSVLRPTSDSIKEALFSILGGRLDGLFVDLFAGTGNVGLEAASRGARAILVERADSSWELLQANLETLEFPEQVIAVHGDAQRFVKAPTDAGDGPARIVFAKDSLDSLLSGRLAGPIHTERCCGLVHLVWGSLPSIKDKICADL